MKMVSIDEEVPEGEKDGGLRGLDLGTAKLDAMSLALERLECEKRSLLENIRILRVRLADEKVMTLCEACVSVCLWSSVRYATAVQYR